MDNNETAPLSVSDPLNTQVLNEETVTPTPVAEVPQPPKKPGFFSSVLNLFRNPQPQAQFEDISTRREQHKEIMNAHQDSWKSPLDIQVAKDLAQREEKLKIAAGITPPEEKTQ